MTLKQRRMIVKKFKEGRNVEDIADETPLPEEGIDRTLAIEQAIRDYMNGVFDLKPKRRKP